MPCAQPKDVPQVSIPPSSEIRPNTPLKSRWNRRSLDCRLRRGGRSAVGEVSNEGEARRAGGCHARASAHSGARGCGRHRASGPGLGVANAAIGDAGPEDLGRLLPKQQFDRRRRDGERRGRRADRGTDAARWNGRAAATERRGAGSVGRAARAGRRSRSTGRRRRRQAEPSREREGNGERGCFGGRDDHGASQSNSGNADASASASLGVGQQQEHPGNAQSANAASGDQSANASARRRR